MTDSLFATTIVKSLVSYGLMAGIALATAALIRLLVAGLARSRAGVTAEPRTSRTEPTPPPARIDDPNVLVAVISAAVCAAIGPGHRIVHIEEMHHTEGWMAELRFRHHTSHHPYR